jgi:hypothetical protein
MDLMRLGHTIKHILDMGKMYEEVCFEGRLLFIVWREKGGFKRKNHGT